MKRTLVGFIAVAMLVAGIAPAMAESPARRVGPEVKVGGLTVAQQVARQRALHAEVMLRMPVGAGDDPLYVDITQKDRDDLAVRPPSGTAPLRVGVVKSVAGAVGKPAGRAFNRGVVEENPDGSFVWAMTVSSPGAQGIRVHLTDFSLPDGAEMFLLGPSEQADGPYGGAGRNGNGDFWTRSIVSDTGTLVVRYTGNTPDVDRPKISFRIADVGHVRGRPPRPLEKNHDSWPCSDNAPCVVDASCGSTGAANPDAIAKMEWIQGPFIYTCTGGLLADTDGSSQIPYFLTANHCLSASNSNLETFFDYTTSSCNGSCPDSLVTGGTPPPASTVGLTVVATGSQGDFTLGTLNQAPPAGAAFLGWNNAPIAFTNGADLHRVSNPNFGPQAYSRHDVDAGSPTCTGWPRGERIYSTDLTGATMGGSSGSPVVNAAGEAVGQLSGCCGFNCGDECDSANNWTVDGALAFYWDQVSGFLDPAPSSCGNGSCGPGEDCNSCPSDCRSKTSGSPSSRYCCDGDLPGCGNPQCSEGGFSCGGGGCSTNPECDDGAFCNGAETCQGGTCQGGSDPCPGQGCNESTDQCVACGGNKAPCSTNADCCSLNCRNGTCKGGG